MKVLIVHYNPGTGGGAESAVRDQRKALEFCGHEVAVEYAHPERAWVRFRPDIVHFHTIHVGLGLDILRWAQSRGIPHCLSLHDYWPFCQDRMLMKYGAAPGSEADEPCAAVEGLCDGQCARAPAPDGVRELLQGTPLVTFNPDSAAIFERHGIHIAAIIPHGINTEVFSPAPGGQVAEARIVTMSAWAGYNTKGMHILRQALGQIGERAMCITGIPRERVPEELRKASIFVFPSTYQETWGLCLTEAMSTGLACIASNVCGTRAQIEDGLNGLLVPPRDATALAAALRYLIDNPAARREMGQKAREWATDNANLGRMGRNYGRFYNGLIGATHDST